MHGFCAVAHGSASQCQIFDQPHYAETVFCGNIIYSAEIFFDIDAQFGVPEIFFGRSGNHQAYCDVFCETCDLIWKPGYILFTHICQQQVDQIVSGLSGWLPPPRSEHRPRRLCIRRRIVCGSLQSVRPKLRQIHIIRLRKCGHSARRHCQIRPGLPFRRILHFPHPSVNLPTFLCHRTAVRR